MPKHLMLSGKAAVALTLALTALATGTVPALAAPTTAAEGRYLTPEQLRARYGDAKGKIANLFGVDIYYKDEGPRTAPVLLMVHGSQSTLRTWDGIAAALKSRYRIVRFDVAGMGLSGPVSDEVAANVTPVQIAKGLLDMLHIKEVTFVGVSSGGTLGTFLAAEHPEMVKRLILSNTPSDRVSSAHMVQPQSFIDAQAQVRKDGGFQSRAFWDEFLNYFAGKPERLSKALRDEYYDINRRTPEKHPSALVARIDDGVESSRKMKMVTAPTLLIWGAKDQLLPLSAMNSLEQHLASAPVSKIILPDAGHYPPLEVPARFGKILKAYIEEAVPSDFGEK